MQALPDGSSKYKVSVPDTITAVAEGTENERMVTISFKFGALSNQSYVFQSSSERYRFLMMLWPMIPGYSPLRVVDDVAARTHRVTSFFNHDSDESTSSSSLPPPLAVAATAPAEASLPAVPENNFLHVFVGTWNHGQYPQDDTSAYDIKSWLQPHPVTQLSSRPELYVIGLQESNTPGFSELLQQTLGSDYVQVASAALSLIPSSVIAIFTFVRKDVAMFVANIETCCVPTGIGGVGGNKGATIVFLTYKHTSIALVNCHLAAGVTHVKSRNRNAMDVLSRATVGRRGLSLEVGCDYCFFFGDLNYRVETLFETAAAAVDGKKWQLLWPYDQLPPEQQSGRALHGFVEGSLNFCPSYRWKTGVVELSNKNGQAASWCDRILLHQHEDFSSRCLSYTSVPSIITSDHRPVYALFRVECPIYDHSKLSPPFRIELSKVSMQLLAVAEPPNAGGSEPQTATLNAPADAAEDGDQMPSTPIALKRLSIAAESPARDSLRDSQSAAGVYTLGVRGNCIEGEAHLFTRMILSPVAYLCFFRRAEIDACHHAGNRRCAGHCHRRA
jgi:hypothetical protein